MGQALTRVLVETPGCAVAAGIETKGSPHVGRDLGELAGLAPLGIAITDDPLPVFAHVDGVLDFTVSGSDRRYLDGVATFVVRTVGLRGSVTPVRIAMGAAPREGVSTIFVGPAMEAPAIGSALTPSKLSADRTPPPPSPPASPPQAAQFGQVPTAKPSAYWALTIISFLCSFLIGAIAMIFSSQVNTKWKAGDVAGARKASQLAMWIGIAGIAGSMSRHSSASVGHRGERG